MRRLILLLFMVVVVSNSVCFGKGVRFGLQGGLNISNTGKVDPFARQSGDGFYVGFLTDIKLVAGLYLQPGLSLVTKGLTVKSPLFETALVGTKTSFTGYYISVPIGVAYKFKVAKSLKLFVTGEPNLNFGVGGSGYVTLKASDDVGQPVTVTGERKVFSSSSDANLGISNFDMGIFVGGGLEFKAIGIKGGYDFGLTNIKGIGGVLDNSKWNNIRVMVSLLF